MGQNISLINSIEALAKPAMEEDLDAIQKIVITKIKGKKIKISDTTLTVCHFISTLYLQYIFNTNREEIGEVFKRSIILHKKCLDRIGMDLHRSIKTLERYNKNRNLKPSLSPRDFSSYLTEEQNRTVGYLKRFKQRIRIQDIRYIFAVALHEAMDEHFEKPLTVRSKDSNAQEIIKEVEKALKPMLLSPSQAGIGVFYKSTIKKVLERGDLISPTFDIHKNIIFEAVKEVDKSYLKKRKHRDKHK